MLKITPDEIRLYLERLDKTPQRIAVLTSALDDYLLRRPPQKMDWSAIQILAHLRSCADIWTFSIYAMLVEDNPRLALIDERRWAKKVGYSELPFIDSLQAYTRQRFELLRVLQDLPFASWARSADIAGRKHTVFSQARRMAKHELEHIAQIESLISSIPANI